MNRNFMVGDRVYYEMLGHGFKVVRIYGTVLNIIIPEPSRWLGQINLIEYIVHWDDRISPDYVPGTWMKLDEEYAFYKDVIDM